jgi:hypothetical protein
LKREGGERAIYDALGQSKSFCGLCAVLSEIERDWASIAGKSLANLSVPRAYDDGVLVVAVKNRSAQQDMNFKKSAILKAVFDKTSLNLKDLRTEISRTLHPGTLAPKFPAPRRKRNAAPVKYGPELELTKAEILARNPGLRPELAEIIAQCRVGRAVR